MSQQKRINSKPEPHYRRNKSQADKLSG